MTYLTGLYQFVNVCDFSVNFKSLRITILHRGICHVTGSCDVHGLMCSVVPGKVSSCAHYEQCSCFVFYKEYKYLSVTNYVILSSQTHNRKTDIIMQMLNIMP